ncbi:tetratricopeptide repeat protein [Streptomyces sp. NPDC003328]
MLGIHPAIPLPSEADEGLSSELPSYVQRDIDSALRAALASASRHGGFVLIVGRAASGKTRSAYEAMKTVLGDWRLAMPANPERLNALVDSYADLTRTVVWLNETQKFLGSGRLTFETFSRLLSSQDPVVVIGTIWPEHFDRLRMVSGIEDGQDLNQDSREILNLAVRISMPDRFSNAEQARAQDLACKDPRIGEAITQSGGTNVTGVLAAAPELIDRWEQASDIYGAAVIRAAVDARRCGHVQPIPVNLLETLTSTYLDPTQKANAKSDWFAKAVEWACLPVRGSVAPIAPYAVQVGSLDGYEVSDILVQHAQRQRKSDTSLLSPQFWSLLIENSTPEVCGGIGEIAYFDGRLDLAEQALRRGVESGDVVDAYNLGVLLHGKGEDDQAIIFWQQAAAEGHAEAAHNIGVLHAERRDVEKASAALQSATEFGYVESMNNLGLLLVEAGDVENGLSWLRRGAEAGLANAMNNLGLFYVKQEDIGQARPWFELGAEAGHVEASYNLGFLCAQQDDKENAVVWYKKAAEAGHAVAMNNLATLFGERDDTREALVWYQRAVEAGHVNAMYNLGLLSLERGEMQEARSWFEKSAETGNVDAMYNLAVLLDKQGDQELAWPWYHEAAATGHTPAMNNLGVMLGVLGHFDDAVEWFEKAIALGSSEAEDNLSALRRILEEFD